MMNDYTQWPFHRESATVPARARSFTNMDRRPVESESVRAVRQAVREMELRKREILAEMANRRPERKLREIERKAEPEQEPQNENEVTEDET